MNEEKTTLEIIAPSVDEAVERGLEQLGLSKDEVEIEVLDSGSKGILGIGGRQSRIRISIKGEIRPSDTETSQIVEPAVTRIVAANEADLSEEDRQALKIARDVVFELLERMKVKAQINSYFVEPEDENDERMVMVDIQGNDLSILIGRRSETLNALQYIASLIASKELGKWLPLMIDVQGYRQRRERQLRQLGRKMADQAVQTGKRQILEPMPANERRIIHLELRNHPQVTTESTGEEPFRKVTILLKK
ncbi:MAG: RNA-binding cell elongation regulator Jag/EloR [Anaerolineaceae bacterium]